MRTHRLAWSSAVLVAAAFAASLVIVSPLLHATPAVSRADARERAVEGYGKLPISFEPNVGQAPSRYDFVARGQGFGMAISATGATLALGTKEAQDLVGLNLRGASRSAGPRALEPLPGKVNYFVGNDPSKWRSDVPTFGRVSYRDVFPGIDVIYQGTNAGTLENDFVVAPNADAGVIRFGFSGANRVALQGRDLVIATGSGAVTQEAPVLYQAIAGRRVPVDGRFSLAGQEVGFEVGAYDHHYPLVIDPTLVYSTYLGGTNGDLGQAIAVDGSGAAYVAGYTTSTNFPALSPFQGANAGSSDAFVTKLNATGSALIYSTYLGGSSSDIAQGIAVDGTGAAYVAGGTDSTNFPTQSPFQGANAGSSDAFVTKLNATGSALIYSTYLGGSSSGAAQGNDHATAIAVDGSGAAYVTGYTSSMDFPTHSPFQGSNAGSTDGFVTKLSTAGSALTYSTYLGGSNDDSAQGIAVDGSGAAYVSGDTFSTNFPTQSPFQGSNAGGGVDAFVTKFNATGSALTYSTYLGGSGGDLAYGIAADGSGAAHVTGNTFSTNFPTQSPFQGTNAGSSDAFVTKLNASGSALSYSTYLGGSSSDLARAIAVDGSGAYVAGSTGSTNFPTQSPFQGSNAGATDAFVTKLTDIPATCAGHTVTIQVAAPNQTTFGTAGNDVINGTTGIDTIYGLGGNDTICGLAGDDIINGGKGNDTLIGGGGNDTLNGDVGDDIINGGTGNDTINGEAGNDNLNGSDGNDIINGGDGNDTAFGHAGNDKLHGGAGNDILVGMEGNDYLYGERGNDFLSGDDGHDHLFGDVGADSLRGGNGDDLLYGGDGNDTMQGDDPWGCSGGCSRNDILYGGDGNDTMYGQRGDDELYGGDGNDIMQGDDPWGGSCGCTQNDILYGGAGNDTMHGNEGNDRLYGGVNNDTLYGGDEKDVLYGNDGHDFLYGNDGGDYLYGNDGHDHLYGNAGDDPLDGGPGYDACDGGVGNDTGTLCEAITNIP